MGCVMRLQKKGLLDRRIIGCVIRKPRKRPEVVEKKIEIKSPPAALLVKDKKSRSETFKRPEKIRTKNIFQLRDFDCRWMFDDGSYCGQRSKSSRKPWCENHHKLVYVKVKLDGKPRKKGLLFGIAR